MNISYGKNLRVGLNAILGLGWFALAACSPPKSRPIGISPAHVEGRKDSASSDVKTSDSSSDSNPLDSASTGASLPVPAGTLTTPANFKVAFVGDQGVSEGSYAVLKLIKTEKTDLLVIPGDFDYEDDPSQWEKMLNETVGDMPLFAAIGNHDTSKWDEYAAILKARQDKMPKAKCTGEIGIKQRCEYEGLVFAISAVGIKGDKHDEFLESALTEKKAVWSICAWHKNQTMLQVGGKLDETGYEVYETCRSHGAIVATAHEHSYSRTFLLSDFTKQTVANRQSEMVLDAGHTFAFVNGLGGKNIREEGEEELWQKIVKALKNDTREPEKGDYWAKIYTANQNANYGALFCTFNVDGNPRRARCEFKNIDGLVVDTFTLVSNV